FRSKATGDQFRVWLLCADYPPQTLEATRQMTARYILQEGAAQPSEFRNRFTGEAVLPTLGGWQHLLPRSSGEKDGRPTELFPQQSRYLGHRYRLETVGETT